MFKKNKLYVTMAMLWAPLVAAPTSAIAQEQSETDEATVEVIMVTTQKRSQSTQAVPVAISAVNMSTLEKTGVDTITSIIPMVPGLTGTTAGIATNVWAIRGISSNDFTAGSEPSVGIFIDEAYIGRNVLATAAFFDIGVVEVVKGPQGTLFGRNASAGAISITTNKPEDDTYFDFTGSAGNEGQKNLGFVANVAATDDLAFRVAYHGTRLEGIWRDTVNDEDAFIDTNNVRLMANWAASDSFSALLTLSAGRAEGNTNGAISPSLQLNSPNEEYPSNIGFSTAPSEESDTNGASLRLTKEFGNNMTLTSITDFRSYDYIYTEDVEGSDDDVTIDAFVASLFGETTITGAVTLEFANPNTEQESLSQEFRLNGFTDKLEWFVGASYFKEDIEEATAVNLLDRAFDLGVLFADSIQTEGSTTSTGLYADGRYALSDELSLTLGARYSSDEKDWCTTASAGLALVTFDTLGMAMCDTQSWDEFTYRMVGDYKISDDVMVYASVATGYKGGGFNASPADLDGDFVGDVVASFDPETSTAYEVGVKSQFLNNSVRLNASVFLVDYQDLQIQTATLGGIIIENAAEVETSGFEAELTYVVTSSLTLRANYSLLNGEFTAGDFTGNDLTYAPKNTYSFAVDYDTELSNGYINWFAMVNWQDDQFFDAGNTLSEDAYALVNGRVSYTPDSDGWHVALAIDNALDKEYAVNRNDIGFGPRLLRGMPRMIRAEVGFRF